MVKYLNWDVCLDKKVVCTRSSERPNGDDKIYRWFIKKLRPLGTHAHTYPWMSSQVFVPLFTIKNTRIERFCHQLNTWNLDMYGLLNSAKNIIKFRKGLLLTTPIYLKTPKFQQNCHHWPMTRSPRSKFP